MITVKGQDYELKGYSPLTFKASDFTTADPNSTGTLADNYNNFYASLAAGRYSFRAYGYKASETSANVYLGGHSLTLPTETNVDGGTGGGADIYLRLHSIYTTSKKNSSDYFTADDYTARVVMPSMGGDVQHGTPYPSGNYTYYPFMLYSAGNAALWNAYVEPIGTCAEDYIFTQAINNTTAAGYTVVTKSLALSQAINLTVTVPAYADFNLFFQHNNFNTQIIEPKTGSTSGDASASADATRTLTYKISKSNSNYTWRLKDIRSGTTYVTKAGWLQSSTTSFAKEFTFNAGDSTDQYSHSFSNLGTIAKTRDEAEIQTFLSPSGYKYTSGTERIRSYRLWQIINSDAANIMIEPEFKVKVLSGDENAVTAVTGGNAKGNWLDVTPNGTTIVAVNYKALDVYTTADEHGTHGGLYPATNPERTSVFVLTNDKGEHGNAKANIAYNSNGLTSSRPSAWDYNYDNWFYLSNDTAPTLDFSVSSSGTTTVQYAIVTTDASDLDTHLSGWTTLTADSSGKYHASLLGFREAGLAGGTVIIKMHDSTGTSYSLARVAEVTATVTNASNPQETEIMPGDKVSLTFEGSYRGIYKYSGIFNPTTYNLFYSIGDTAYKTNVAQYQQMDQAKLELTIPTNVDFGSGSTANVQLTNGYTYGSMYSAANPFATLYNMSDTGVGTNFNAVTVNFCLNRFPNVNVEVTPRYNFKLKLNITNPTTATPTVTLTDAAGNVHTANSNGEYENLPYGTYTYAVLCAGCDYVYGSFYLGSADKGNVSGGVLTKTIPLTASAAGAWDGTTKTQPTLTDGVYQIGTAAELAWFAAQVNGGSYAINGALTSDIDLAGYNWTPIGGTTASTAFKGSFNGNNHTVKNMGIYYSATTTSAPYKGLFGYVNGTSSSYATIQNLKVTGKMYLTSTGSVSNAYSGGVVAYANYTNISGVVSDVDITVTRVNGNWSSVGGVAGRLVNSNATNCGNEGTIHAYQYVGGITGYATGTITGCYNGGAITGNGYVAGIVGQTTKGVTACYNTGSITGAGNYVAGIVAFASGASASVKNCYNRAYVESIGSNVGAVVGMTNNASAAMSNLYYLDFTCAQGIGSAKSTSQTATAKTRAEMDSADFVTSMNTGLTTAAFGSSRYSPALTWQTDLIGLTTPTVGNVNLDPFGYVDEEDLALLTEWKDAGKTKKDLTAEQWAQADLNDDGKLNDEDVEILAAYLEDPRLNDLS
jgi:bacterial Ig-like domain (group 2)./fibronectin type III domain